MAFYVYNKGLKTNKLDESFDFDYDENDVDSDFFEAESNVDFKLIAQLLDSKSRELTAKYTKYDYYEDVNDYENKMPNVYVQLASKHTSVSNKGISLIQSNAWNTVLYLWFNHCKADALIEFIDFIKNELISSNVKLDNSNIKIGITILNITNDKENVIDLSPLLEIFTNHENVYFNFLHASAKSKIDTTFVLRDISCAYIALNCGKFDFEKTHFDFNNITFLGGQVWRFGNNSIELHPDKFFKDIINGDPFNGAKVAINITKNYNKSAKCDYYKNFLNLLSTELPKFGSSIFNARNGIIIETFAKSATEMMKLCSSIIEALKKNTNLTLDDKNKYGKLFLNNIYDSKENRMYDEFYTNTAAKYNVEPFPIVASENVNESFDFDVAHDETDEIKDTTYFEADTEHIFSKNDIPRFSRMIKSFEKSEYGKNLGLNLTDADFKFDSHKGAIVMFETVSQSYASSKVINIKGTDKDFDKAVEALKILKLHLNELGYNNKIEISNDTNYFGRFIECNFEIDKFSNEQPHILNFSPFYEVFNIEHNQVIVNVITKEFPKSDQEIVVENCKNLMFEVNEAYNFVNVTLKNCTFTKANTHGSRLINLVNSKCVCKYSPVYKFLQTTFEPHTLKEAYEFFRNCSKQDILFSCVGGEMFQSVKITESIIKSDYRGLLCYSYLYKSYNDFCKALDTTNEYASHIFSGYANHIQCDWSYEKMQSVSNHILTLYQEEDILVTKDFLRNYVYSDFEDNRLPKGFYNIFNYGNSELITESFEFNVNSDEDFFEADTNKFDENNFIGLCELIDDEFRECPSGSVFGDLYNARHFMKFKNNIITVEHPENFWQIELEQANIEIFNKIEKYLKENNYNKKIETNFNSIARFYYTYDDSISSNELELIDISAFFRVFDSMKGYWDIDVSADMKELKFSAIDNIHRIRGNCFALCLENCVVKDETFIECYRPTALINTTGKHHCTFYGETTGQFGDLSDFFGKCVDTKFLTLTPKTDDYISWFFYNGAKLYDALCNTGIAQDPVLAFKKIFRYCELSKLEDINPYDINLSGINIVEQIKKFKNTKFYKDVISSMREGRGLHESYNFDDDTFFEDTQDDFYKANTHVFTAESLRMALESINPYLRRYMPVYDDGTNLMTFNSVDSKIYMAMNPINYGINKPELLHRFNDTWKSIKHILEEYGYNDKVYVVGIYSLYACSLNLDSYVDYKYNYDIDLSPYFDLFDFSKNESKCKIIVQADDCLKMNLTIRNGHMLEIAAQLNSLKIENSSIFNMVISCISSLPAIKDCVFESDNFTPYICLPRLIDVKNNKVDVTKFFETYESDCFPFELDCAENTSNPTKGFLNEYFNKLITKLYEGFVSAKSDVDNVEILMNEFMSLFDESFRDLIDSYSDFLYHSDPKFKQTRFCEDFVKATKL